MIELTFQRESETRNTVRFDEVLGDRDRGIVGRLCLLKAQDDRFGQPELLQVTIQPAPAGVEVEAGG